MKKAPVIFNPVSGYKKWGDIRALIKEQLTRKAYEWTWIETSPHQALQVQIQQKETQGPWDLVLVSGGDGTVAEAVRTLLELPIKAPLSILPQGSANLLALSLGIPLLNPARAIQVGLGTKQRKLDVMKINRKYYGMIAVGRGYDAFLMKETPRELKRKMGLLAYAWIFLKTALFYRSHPYTLKVDGQRFHVVAKSIMVFNLFPLPFTPIKPEDGQLNVLALTAKGKVLHHAGKTISIKAHREALFQLDGEALTGKSLTVEILPQVLTIQVP